MTRPQKADPKLSYHKRAKLYYVRFAGEKPTYLGPDKADAERLRLRIIARRLAAVEAPAALPVTSPPPGDGPTLAEALLEYQRFAHVHYAGRQRTVNLAAAAADAALEVFPDLPAAAFGAPELENVQEALLGRRTREGLPLSRNYINKLVSRLKTAFRWLERKRHVPPGAWHHLRTVPALEEGGREPEDVPPVEPWVVEATLPFCRPTLAALIRVHQASGMRPDEVVRMRRDRLSTSPDERIALPNSRGRKVCAQWIGGQLIWLYVPEKHKNSRRGKVRVVGLGPDAQEVLAPIVAARSTADFLFRPADDIAELPANPMIRAGECYTTNSYLQAVRRAVRRARRAWAVDKGVVDLTRLIPYWSPGQIRHEAAERIADSTDPDKAAAILGHSASRRALDHYIRVTLQTIAETAAKVG